MKNKTEICGVCYGKGVLPFALIKTVCSTCSGKGYVLDRKIKPFSEAWKNELKNLSKKELIEILSGKM